MDKILYSPKEGTSGFCGLRDVPEEPNWNLTSLSNDVKKGKYREALESCKSNMVEIVNIHDNRSVLQLNHDGIDYFIGEERHGTVTIPIRKLIDGDLFDLPEGYEFKEEEKSDGWMSLTKVLRLVKTETKEDVTKAPESVDTYIGKMYIGGDALGWQKQIDKWIENDKNGIPPINSKEKLWRLKYHGVIEPEPEESQMFTKSDLRDAFLAGYWLHLDSDNNDLATRKDKFENVFYKGLIQRKKQ